MLNTFLVSVYSVLNKIKSLSGFTTYSTTAFSLSNLLDKSRVVGFFFFFFLLIFKISLPYAFKAICNYYLQGPRWVFPNRKSDLWALSVFIVLLCFLSFIFVYVLMALHYSYTRQKENAYKFFMIIMSLVILKSSPKE